MKSAVTLADAANLGDPRDEVFDLYRAYAKTLLDDPKRDEETAERQGYFHPSSVTYCARGNVYEARREVFKSRLGVQDLEIFSQGHYVHDRVQSVLEILGPHLEKQGLLWKFQREVPYDKKKDRLFADLRTGGTCDGELWVEKPGEWVQHSILEAKSMKDEFWQNLKRPRDSDLMQAHLYAFRFGAPIIYFWYFNKNTGKHRVIPWVYDPTIFAAAVDRLVIFNDHLDAGTLPPREESWFFCNRCEYQDSCKPLVIRKQAKKSAATPTRVRRTGFGNKGGSR